jgi:hypothetical protein
MAAQSRSQLNAGPEPRPYSGVRAAFAALANNEKGATAMANILVSIEKGIEVGAEDVLKWLVGAGKALHAAPAAIAALATLAAALEKPLAELAGAAANPLNIPLDIQTAHDLKAAWPEVKAFMKSLGVKM